MFERVSRTFVALDLETTGLDPDRDRIIEIGAVRFTSDGEEVDSFQTLVNPGRAIPYFTERLTGIAATEVRGAPVLADVADELRGFVGSEPVVGQNIGFDLAFLRREGVAFEGGAFDTASMSRFLVPGRQSRGLMALAATLEVEAGNHHRALADARTAAAIFVALLRRAAELPAEQRQQLARLVSIHDPALAALIGEDGATPVQVTRPMLPEARKVEGVPPLVRREKRQPVAPAAIGEAFRTAMSVVEQFEERAEQVQMAEAVAEAFARGGHYLVEAGTGVGKSLAYLVPAALNAIRNGERVVISTNTINLQEQLLRKDIPALRRILLAAGAIENEEDLRASLLKGRGNYLCMQRFVANFASGLGDPDFAHLGASLLLWLPDTETGDRAELNLDQGDWLTWQRISAQDADCLSRQNRFVRDGQCFLLRARKSAESAHLIIVNHALLLADIASNGSALPAYDHLIIDEAHNLEDQATQQFGASISRRRVAEAMDGLHRRGSREHREGGVVALLRALPEGGANMAGKALEKAVAQAQAALVPCFEALGRQVRDGGGDEDRLLVTRAVRARPSWADTELAWDALDHALKEVNDRALNAARIVAVTPAVEDAEALSGEIQSAAWKVEEMRLKHAELMGAHDDETIVWISRERDGGGTLNAAPLDVGPTLWESLFSKKSTVVATSATLSAGGSMDYSARRLGLESPETLMLGSPFDYRSSTLLAAFTDIPEPSATGHIESVARAVTELVRASEGRALALFTSHSSLREVAGLVRPELEGEGIVVLAQGPDGSPRQLTENLMANSRTLVLGTASFWEGVDIRGEALSLLIIARLPFAVPTDPVYRARSEQYSNAFGQYALPQAILRFRQGFGRLIRDRNDRGVVAVLDPRIYEKPYGRQFVAALPECTRVRDDTAAVAARVREWLRR